MPPYRSSFLGNPIIFLILILAFGLAEGAANDRRQLKKFKGLYSGEWVNQDGRMPLRIVLPKKKRGLATGSFEATPCDPSDQAGILHIRVQRSKLSRKGKKVVRTGVATWLRAGVPQLGGPNETGAFRMVARLRGRRAVSKGVLSVGLKSGYLNIRNRGNVPLVPAPWMEMVTVGNKGNSLDTIDGDDVTGGTQNFGSVGYDFKIGRHEVTNSQYAEFLNSIAGEDVFGVYAPEMGSDPRGGITRSGTSPNFVYEVKANMGAKPVNFVSFWNACRFCNWMHNGRRVGGQNTGTTEGGAYRLTALTISGNTVTRELRAKYFLPSENEWYKAAFHHPSKFGGDSDDFWLYPMGTNTQPTRATADATGNINNDTASIANYNFGCDWNGQDGNVTTVGSGGEGSKSFYGGYDFAGNLWEWNESITETTDRVIRGGALWSHESFMRSTTRNNEPANLENGGVGFRVAGHR